MRPLAKIKLILISDSLVTKRPSFAAANQVWHEQRTRRVQTCSGQFMCCEHIFRFRLDSRKPERIRTISVVDADRIV